MIIATSKSCYRDTKWGHTYKASVLACFGMKFSVNVSVHHLTNISFTFRKSTRKLVSSMEVKILLMKKKKIFFPHNARKSFSEYKHTPGQFSWIGGRCERLVATVGEAHCMREETGRMRPLGLHEIKVLEEEGSTAKDKFTRLLIWASLPVDKVNA